MTGYVLIEDLLPWLELSMIVIAGGILVVALVASWGALEVYLLVQRHRYASLLEGHLDQVEQQAAAIERRSTELETALQERRLRVTALEEELKQVKDPFVRSRAQRDIDLVKHRLDGLKERSALRDLFENSSAEVGYSYEAIQRLHDIRTMLGEVEQVDDPELRRAHDHLREVFTRFLAVFDSMGDSTEVPERVRPIDPDLHNRIHSAPVFVVDLTTDRKLYLEADERDQYLEQHPDTLFSDIPTLVKLQRQVLEAIKQVESHVYALQRDWDLD